MEDAPDPPSRPRRKTTRRSRSAEPGPANGGSARVSKEKSAIDSQGAQWMARRDRATAVADGAPRGQRRHLWSHLGGDAAERVSPYAAWSGHEPPRQSAGTRRHKSMMSGYVLAGSGGGVRSSSSCRRRRAPNAPATPTQLRPDLRLRRRLASRLEDGDDGVPATGRFHFLEPVRRGRPLHCTRSAHGARPAGRRRARRWDHADVRHPRPHRSSYQWRRWWHRCDYCRFCHQGGGHGGRAKASAWEQLMPLVTKSSAAG